MATFTRTELEIIIFLLTDSKNIKTEGLKKVSFFDFKKKSDLNENINYLENIIDEVNRAFDYIDKPYEFSTEDTRIFSTIALDFYRYTAENLSNEKETKNHLESIIEKTFSGEITKEDLTTFEEFISNYDLSEVGVIAVSEMQKLNLQRDIKDIKTDFTNCSLRFLEDESGEIQAVIINQSEEEIRKEEEKKLATENEENTFTSDFLFKTKESSISELAKSYALVSLETSFYIMENKQLIQVDSEEQTIKNITYEKNQFTKPIQLINNLPQEPKQIVRDSFLELGLNGYLLGLAIAGGIVQPLKSYPANGEYILIFNSLSFQIIFYDDDIVECQLYIHNPEKIEDDEIPF